MPNLFYSKKAQAAVELAIIGSLIILAFSYLIIFTAKVNMRQKHLQDVFKELVGGAGNPTGGRSHATAILFERLPNILEPYSPGQLTPISKVSGKVLWSPGGTRGDYDAGAKWGNDYSEEWGTYPKTFTRTEVPGKYPTTRRTVEYGGVKRWGP